jgi:hypothetical protein
MNEICAKCGKPKSEHHGRRMTVHPYGWELACTVNGIDHFTPRETVSVPKDFVEEVRMLAYGIGFDSSVLAAGHRDRAKKLRDMLDQIDGKDGGK